MRHMPYTFKPEFVRGCTMRCVFCGLRHQKWAEEYYQYIDPKLFTEYCQAIAVWRPKHRMEIANRGEQMLHPEFLKLIEIARKHLPKSQILVTTNTDVINNIGAEAFVELVKESMRIGVNVYLLDCYTKSRLDIITKVFSGISGTFFDTDNSQQINPYPYRGPDFKAICIKDATMSPKENVLLQYHNQGGNANVSDNPNALKMYPNVTLPPEPLKRMCVRPFREFPMWFDGSIPICCDDWADEHIIGKFPDNDLPTLWDLYDEARAHLIKFDRAGLTPCKRCTERSGMRYGLELNWFEGESKDGD